MVGAGVAPTRSAPGSCPSPTTCWRTGTGATGRRPPTAPLDDALTVPTEGPDPQSTLEMSEQVQRVRAAVRALAQDRQQLLALKYVEGLTNTQIGDRMGRSEGAIKALHHRTLRQLQETLGEP